MSVVTVVHNTVFKVKLLYQLWKETRQQSHFEIRRNLYRIMSAVDEPDKNIEQDRINDELSSEISLDDGSPKSSKKLKKDRVNENSQLYIKVDRTKWPMIYSSDYNISFLGLEKLHPFDSGKWGRIVEFLKEAKMVREETMVKPLEASEEDLLVVHSKSYINSLKWSMNVAGITEVPPVAFLPNFVVQRKVLRPFRYQTGGTILAGKLAMDRGWAINIGGGFHHCSAERGGGFCAYADITLTIKFLFNKVEGVSKVMIVDLDAHQGNGHERDFMYDDRVYILDVYNRGIYPHDGYAKRAIKKKVELNHFTDDVDYLHAVEKNLTEALAEFKPDIIVYNAGTDILEGDPLGNLSVTPEGVIKRDEIVFKKAKEAKIPILMLTSGGYMKTTAKIIADSILNLRKEKLIECEEAEKATNEAAEIELMTMSMTRSQSEGSLLSRCRTACASLVSRSPTQEFTANQETGQTDKG